MHNSLSLALIKIKIKKFGAIFLSLTFYYCHCRACILFSILIPRIGGFPFASRGHILVLTCSALKNEFVLFFF